VTPHNKALAKLIPEDLSPFDREQVEGFRFFLSVAGGPSDHHAPHRQLARDWYNGLLTVREGNRIVEERQVWQGTMLDLSGGQS
jgi:hypothetical protein